jgi:L,D-transpeptidase ErfK/SrfK
MLQTLIRSRFSGLRALVTGAFRLSLLWLPLQGSATSFPLPPPGEDVVGEVQSVTAHYADTFSDIARTYDLGYQELVDANPGIDPWLPGEGTEVLVPTRHILPPTPRKGVVINLPEMRLYYYPKGENRVITHPLGIGREGWSTPTGSARVVRKRKNPAWRPPESIRREAEAAGTPLPLVIEAGPDNPLGDYAVYLSMPGYLLHGTNKPYGVGMRVSHGCIRLYPEDIAALFPRLPVGTSINIVDLPYKTGWAGGALLIEAHSPLTEPGSQAVINLTPLVSAVVASLKGRKFEPDWDNLKEAVVEHLGYPVPVTMARSGAQGSRFAVPTLNEQSR